MMSRVMLLAWLLFAGVACASAQASQYVQKEADADRAAAAQGFEVSEQIFAEADQAEARGDHATARRKRDQGRAVENLAQRAEQGADTKIELSKDFNEVEEEREELLGSAGFQEGVEFLFGAFKSISWAGALIALSIVAALAGIYAVWKSKGGAISGVLGGILGKAGGVVTTIRGFFGGSSDAGN